MGLAMGSAFHGRCSDGRAEKMVLSTAILERFGWDPAKIVRFASTSDACSLC